jgi:hypothetical protein
MTTLESELLEALEACLAPLQSAYSEAFRTKQPTEAARAFLLAREMAAKARGMGVDRPSPDREEMRSLIEAAIWRVETENADGNPILSGWAKDARRVIGM